MTAHAPAFHRLLRVAGRDATARQVLAHALATEELRLTAPTLVTATDEDPVQIDLALSLARAARPEPYPRPGISYAGLAPSQRYAFLTWSADPTQPAPPVFQNLFLAHLECALLAGGQTRINARAALLECDGTPAWQASEPLLRALLLAFWLEQDGPGLTHWLIKAMLPAALLGVAIGQQALLGQPLEPAQLPILVAAWQLPARGLSPDVLRLRLSSLETSLGKPPLHFALAAVGSAVATPRPWRTAHRDLRIALPQPDLRPHLEPLIADMLTVAGAPDESPAPTMSPARDQPVMEDLGWRLILEFGHSRSEYFDHVLQQMRRLPEYSEIMDEDRRLIHRVIFRKSEMRRFWRVWDFVRSWSACRVYINGVELEKWQIWPYSQYMR